MGEAVGRGRTERRGARENASDVLHDFADRILQEALAVALEGPWREWERSQPIGSRASFGADDLVASRDTEVMALVALSRRARAASRALRCERV